MKTNTYKLSPEEQKLKKSIIDLYGNSDKSVSLTITAMYEGNHPELEKGKEYKIKITKINKVIVVNCNNIRFGYEDITKYKFDWIIVFN